MNSYWQNYMNSRIETTHVFEKNRNICDKSLSEEAKGTTPVDWDNLQSIISFSDVKARTILYAEALEYFKNADLSKYNEKITTTIKKSKIRNIFSCLFAKLNKSKLKQEFIDDYKLLFLIAKCPYEKDNETHTAILRTIYDSLVFNKDLEFNWENIGFQSNLPWTDLRGVGMFGVLQLLYLSTSHPILNENLHELSMNKFNNTFPFAVVSLNITSIVLNVLRNEKLNRDINKEGVFPSANKLYAAIFYRFGNIWIDDKKSILDIGKMFKDLEESCLSKSARNKIMKQFNCELILWTEAESSPR